MPFKSILEDGSQVEGVGTVELPTKRTPSSSGPDGHTTLRLTDVLHVPGAECNILGLPVAHEYKLSTNFRDPSKGSIRDHDGQPLAYFRTGSPDGLLAVRLSGPPIGPKVGPSPLTGKGYYINASWSKAEKQKWTAHRAQISVGHNAASRSQSSAGTAANSTTSFPMGPAEPVGEPATDVEELSKNRVLLVSLEFQPYFDQMYNALLDQLASKSRLQRAKSATSAIRLLSQNPAPTAVLVTDQALTEPENASVWEAALQYIRQGGTLVAMGHFPAFTPPPDLKPFFAKAGLPWEVAEYHRTTLSLNRAVVKGSVSSKLPSEYSQKALTVKNVAPGDVWYGTTPDSVVESRVFAPTSVHMLDESPVVLAKVGNGKLGYVGDVNAEEGSNLVILAMCGLL